MPSLSFIKNLRGFVNTDGVQRKIDADRNVEDSWDSDLASRVGYIYDYDHDLHRTQLDDLMPFNDKYKIPVDVKYIVYYGQTYEKDKITYHIQFKPSFIYQKVCKYYDEVFKDRYDAMFPCGMYIDLPDSKGHYNRWLCVGMANYNDPQFATYEVMRCDKVIQWIMDGKKMQMAGALRSQNSYNSGIWNDHVTTIAEDQQKFILPANRITEKIYYNLRLIIDNKVLTEPRAWQISKVNRIVSNGVIVFTTAQDKFNSHTDYVEIDERGNVIGMWANYYTDSLEPAVDPTPPILLPLENYSLITYSGTSPVVKAGGSYKKFSVTFYDRNNNPISYEEGGWNFYIDDAPADDLVAISTTGIDENQIKVKFIGDDTYIGKVLVIKHTSLSTQVASSLDVSIVGL